MRSKTSGGEALKDCHSWRVKSEGEERSFLHIKSILIKTK